MINEFGIITQNNEHLKMNLGVDIDAFAGNDESFILRVINTPKNGIYWVHNSCYIEKSEANYKIIGYPSPDLSKIIVIYPIDHNVYPSPNNCVIFNEDGTIYRKLIPPTLISSLAKEFYKASENFYPYKIFFKSCSWKNDDSNKTICAIQIGFNMEFSETREYDIDRNEFKGLISTSKN